MANDFLPFAFDPRANVLRPEVWADDPQRARGFGAGPARSAKVNTVLRQVTFVTAALAQFLADTTGEDVRDNSDLAAFAEQFRRALGIRPEVLLADRELYVAPLGNDANPGTQAAPFRTLQAAADYVQRRIDLAGHNVTVRVAPGGYESGVVLSGTLADNPVQLSFIGDETNPSSTVIAKTAGTGACFSANHGAMFTVAGFELRNTTFGLYGEGTGIYSGRQSVLLARNMHFGACTVAHSYTWDSALELSGNLRIVGSAPYTLLMSTFGLVGLRQVNITVLGAPTIATFAQAQGLSQGYFEVLSVSGALPATLQCLVTQNSMIALVGSALPGGLPPHWNDGGLYFGPSGVTPAGDRPAPVPFVWGLRDARRNPISDG